MEVVFTEIRIEYQSAWAISHSFDVIITPAGGVRCIFRSSGHVADWTLSPVELATLNGIVLAEQVLSDMSDYVLPTDAPMGYLNIARPISDQSSQHTARHPITELILKLIGVFERFSPQPDFENSSR